MNVNELMIGNWVTFPHGNDVVETISFSDDDPDTSPYFHTHAIDGHHPEDIRPIELTPEILMKAGFTASTTDNSYWKADYSIWYEKGIWMFAVSIDGGDTDGRLIVSKVEAVHQLQTLFFCLTGTHLTITL